MRTEFVYSFMALGAIPVAANAADVNVKATQINDALLQSANGKLDLGKIALAPGKYALKGLLTSTVYDVKVIIDGEVKETIEANSKATPLDVVIDLSEKTGITEVEIALESTDPTESGADFSLGAPYVNLTFDFEAVVKKLDDLSAALNTKISGYAYAAKKEDADSLENINLKIANIEKGEKASYDDYLNYKLYAEKSTIQEEIEALDTKTAAAEAAYQNEQAYNRVNAKVTAIKSKYNTAITELEETLVGVAAYLLSDAKKDLNDNINKKITEATQASYASYQAGTAVADEATNSALVPTEESLNTLKTKYTGETGLPTQAKTNIDAYNALHAIVTDLQTQLNAIAPVAESVATAVKFTEDKTAAQTAIDAVNTDVEGAKNSATQLTLDVTTKKTAAQGKITALKSKVDTANEEYNANEATNTAIQTLQTNLNNAKTAVNALKSADGQYEAKNYYDAYVTAIQTAITTLSVDAAKAYKADGTGTAKTFNANLDTKTVQDSIDVYAGTTEPAVDGMPKQAVAKYDALQTAKAAYKTQLDAARAQVEGLAIYNDTTYAYKTKLDLIQKSINQIQKDINAAKEKKGSEHWNAMLAIEDPITIPTQIENLLAKVQSDQNQYDADVLKNGLDTLDVKIKAFNGKAADASVYGADVATFKDVENGIEAGYTAVKNAKDAIDASSETVDYTAIVNADVSGWATDFVNPGYWSNYQNQTINGLGMVEHWCDASNKDKTTGNVLHQTLTDVPNGTYSLEVYANAVDQSNSNVDKEDIAFVFANGQTTPIKVTGGATNAVYKVDNVVVADGILKFGINKAKGGTNWHSIQIKSLTANTASLIQGWGAKVTELNAQQATLETVTDAVAAKVTANGKAKSGLATSIGDNTTSPKKGLFKTIDDFKNTYKVGTDESTLGNRGKASGAITTEINDVLTALTKLQGNNTDVDTTAVTNVDKTDKVSKDASAWGGSVPPYGDQTIVEKYESTTANIGNIMSQKVTGLDNGIYDVTLRANANFTPGRGFDGLSADANDVAYIYANDIKQFITAKVDGGTDGEYTISKVLVTDGTLDLGMAKVKPGTNWHTIQIKSLTYHENDLKATYNNAEKSGLNDQYTKLAAKMDSLNTVAPNIVKAVAQNDSLYKVVNTEMAGLKSHLEDKLKADTDVNLIIKADGNFSGSAKMSVYEKEDFVLYRTGLDKDYGTVRKELLADTVAMRNAIEAAFANESLNTEWKSKSITVVTEDDPATTDVNEASSTTYSIETLKATINAIRSTAETEQANWYGYRHIRSTGKNDIGTKQKVNDTYFTNSFTAARKDLATKAGAGAADYYVGLVGNGADITGSYEDDLAAIRLRMFNSLKARTAVADQAGFVTDLKALKAKIDKVQADAAANLAKYNEQHAAADSTQTLWNSTYTEIAATDKSSKVQDWLDELDTIQVTLTAATEAVEENYKIGKSVAEAKDFAAIQASINDVKARQSESYSEFVAADNKAAHESFMGNETKKGAIQLATEAYQTAVQERAKYSATNADIKAAVETAAATLDAALYSCPTDIEALTKAENEAYAAVVSPEVFDVDPFNTQALTIETNITNALNTFKDAVKAAIKDNVWQPKKTTYDSKVTAAKNAIAAYADDAKKDAFKDVETLIAAGETALNAWTLAGVEAAIEGLEDIDNMLAADKDAAAEKDINKRIAAADTKYTTVKTYIEGKTIADDVNNVKATKLAEIEAKYDDKNDNTHTDVAYAKTLAKTFAKHDEAAAILDGFITIADNAKTAVDNAIAADVNNTKAYNEMVEAIKPVADKLAEAEAAAAPYKYATSFETDETTLDGIKTDASTSKANGNAVAKKATVVADLATLSTAIETTLTTAFGTEKTGLSADITELKNQYNAYVAANGLGETATAYKKDIDDLEAAVAAIAIEDLDKPTDGIQYDEILAATAKLVKLQKDIADKQTELLKANASTANADVLADFTTQIGDLETAASLEGNDAWVGEQTVGGKKISEAIAAIQAQIADVKAAIEAEENISFYKDQYQAEIDAIEADLAPVTAAITAKQAQFTANADAYTTLSAAITTLQGKVDAAKAKVAEYKYNGVEYDYTNYIEVYNDKKELTGGLQKTINDAVAALETAKENVSLTANSKLTDFNLNVTTAENTVQNYLDDSAKDELYAQENALNTALINAIDVKYKAETYSSRLWARLIDEKNGIRNEINDLYYEVWNSYQVWKSTPDYNWVIVDNQKVAKTRTSDADYATQMQTVAAIAQKIADLSAAVDNLGLLGDANEDGKVNVLDYQKVLNMILDPTMLPEDGSDLFLNTDINKNNVVEVGDLTSIVNYILTHDWAGNYAAARGMMAEGESLTMTQGTNRIAVNLANVSNYTAFQMDLVLPEGMKMVGAQLSDRAGESHKLYSRAQMDGSIRLLASSVTGEAFSGNEGAVLYIDVEGVGTPELLNILFADVNAQTRFFSLGNDATGIDNVSMFESLKAKVFDFGGRMKNRMQKGFNIIRRADGTTQKVVK